MARAERLELPYWRFWRPLLFQLSHTHILTAVAATQPRLAPCWTLCIRKHITQFDIMWHISQTLEVPLAMPDRRAPDRLAALLTAFRLIYRVLPASDFYGWERPNLRLSLVLVRRALRRDLPNGRKAFFFTPYSQGKI